MKINDAVTALASLAQETRLAVFRYLVAEGEPVAAGDIAAKLKVAPATLSFHLKELANAGLITQSREGRSLLYAVNRKGMAALMEFLAEDCCKGQPELCGVSTGKTRARKKAMA